MWAGHDVDGAEVHSDNKKNVVNEGSELENFEMTQFWWFYVLGMVLKYGKYCESSTM